MISLKYRLILDSKGLKTIRVMLKDKRANSKRLPLAKSGSNVSFIKDNNHKKVKLIKYQHIKIY